MSIDTPTLVRAAGISSIVALVGLIVSGITIALFFGGAGAWWGPINDLAVAATLVALLLPVLAIDRLALPSTGLWLRIVTVAALAGLTLAAVGQVALVLGVIDLQTSFVTGGVGIIPFFVWLVALAVIAFRMDVLPSTLGGLVVAIIVLTIVMTLVSTITMGPILWVAGLALVVAQCWWLASLASSLMSSAGAA